MDAQPSQRPERPPCSILDSLPNDLESYWLPFTPNRDFKSRPRAARARPRACITATRRGAKVLDAISGLWCVNAGHARKPIVEAIRAQAGELDYAPSFHFAHPKVVRLAGRDRSARAQGARQRLLLQFGFGSRRHRDEDRARLFRRPRVRAAASASSAGRAPITASISAACRWAASPTTRRASARFFRVRIIACRFPTITAKDRFTKGRASGRRELCRRAREDRRRVRRARRSRP